MMEVLQKTNADLLFTLMDYTAQESFKSCTEINGNQ